MHINVKFVAENPKVPCYANPGDAGLDLYTNKDYTLWPGDTVSVGTGIAVEIPEGYVGLIWDKSGLALTSRVSTLAGVIDSGYRGEVRVVMIYHGEHKCELKAGQKIAQMLIQPVERVEVKVVDALSKTERGTGGFGSTGV